MLKLAAAVALFAGFCWFGTQVQLGPHTLFGHLHAIAGTKESQDLFDGTKESAKPLVEDVRRRIAGAPDPGEDGKTKVQEKDRGKDQEKLAEQSPGHSRGAKPETKSETKSDTKSETKPETKTAKRDGKTDKEDETTASERRRLRRLISSAEGASAPR
jgi:Mg-chelatase subunit ChlI